MPKNRLDGRTLELLAALARERGVEARLDRAAGPHLDGLLCAACEGQDVGIQAGDRHGGGAGPGQLARDDPPGGVEGRLRRDAPLHLGGGGPVLARSVVQLGADLPAGAFARVDVHR